ncbi:hypothetical protein ACX0HA_04595 [Flavobacterium hauense]
MKRHFLLLLLAIVLFSCNRQSDFEKKLIEGKWVDHEGDALTDEIDKWPSVYLRFYEDGSYMNFHITGSEMPLINDDGSESKEPFLWSYDPDEKVLMVNKRKFKVLSIEGDTIRMVKETSHLMLYNIDKTYPKLKKGPGHCLGG